MLLLLIMGSLPPDNNLLKREQYGLMSLTKTSTMSFFSKRTSFRHNNIFRGTAHERTCAFYLKSNFKDMAVLKNYFVQEIVNSVLQEIFIFVFLCQEGNHFI